LKIYFRNRNEDEDLVKHISARFFNEMKRLMVAHKYSELLEKRQPFVTKHRNRCTVMYEIMVKQ